MGKKWLSFLVMGILVEAGLLGYTAAISSAKTIRILALAWPQAPVEQELADKYFTPKTGIKVVIEAQPYTYNEQKARQEVAAGSSYYDIYHYDSQWGGNYIVSGALERLDTKECLLSPDSTVDFDRDFFPELTYRSCKYPTIGAELDKGNFQAFKDTAIYGLPWSQNCEVLFYNKTRFKEAGLDPESPPETWEEFREYAIKLTNPPDRYGVGFSASPAADYISMEFFPMMWSWGGALWDPYTWTAEGYVNSSETIAALEFFSDLYLKDKVCPPDTPNWDMDPKLSALLTGLVAMAPEWTPLLGALMDDPKASQHVGQIGMGVMPGKKDPATGEIRRFHMYGCQGTGINARSKNKKEAWQYLQWLVSYDTQKALTDNAAAAFVSGRRDLRYYAAGLNRWDKAFIDAIPTIRDFWNIPPYAELLFIQNRETNLAFMGAKSPAEAMNYAAKLQQAIYDASPYKPKG